MSTNLNTISDILKEQYLPALQNQITTAPSPFMEMIKKVPLTTGGKITAVAPFGINGGFGFGSDGNNTPASGARKYKRFEVEPVDMYVDIRISDKTVKLANEEGALISALEDEVMGSYESAKWNVSRALFGDGSGKLCALTAASVSNTSASTVTLTVDGCANLIEGLTVDVYSYASATADATLPANNGGYRIAAIDRENKKVVLEGSGATATVKNTAKNDYGFLCVQGSYNKELTGLKAIFDDGVSEIYGYNKTTHAFVAPLKMDAAHAVSDMVIYDAVKKSADYRNGNIDLVMLGDKAFRAYQNYMRERLNPEDRRNGKPLSGRECLQRRYFLFPFRLRGGGKTVFPLG